MCIAIYKPHDVNLLDIDTYERCWNRNRDGAGIAIWREDLEKWEVIKGMMTWEAWKRNYESFIEHDYIQDSDAILFHFRIGTAGPKSKEGLTHPFPVVDDYDKMKETSFLAKNIVMHNGTIARGEPDFSDTMWAVRDFVRILGPKLYDEKTGDVLDQDLEEILKHCLEADVSRWCVCWGPHIYLYGPWKEDEGVFYSNTDYKYVPPTRSTAYTRGGTTTHLSGSSNTRRVLREGSITEFLRKKKEGIDEEGSFSWSEWNGKGRWHDSARNKSVTYFPFKSNDDTSESDDPVIAISDNTADTKSDNVTKKVERRLNANALVMAIVDENGNLHWSEDIIDDDLLFCPMCGSDDTMRDRDVPDSDIVCLKCECLFDAINGKIYDTGKAGATLVYCLYCGDYVHYDSENNTCIECGGIIDPNETLAEGGA